MHLPSSCSTYRCGGLDLGEIRDPNVIHIALVGFVEDTERQLRLAIFLPPLCNIANPLKRDALF